MNKEKSKNLALLFLLLSLSVSGFSKKRTEHVPEVTPITSVNDGENISFTCANCTESEKKIVPKVQKLVNAVIRTPCFADRYILEKYRSKLIQTNGLTRKQVVDKILTTVVVAPLFFYYPTIFQSKSVVGYTMPGEPTIYLNRRFRNDSTWTLCSEASNLTHEATHKMEFTHDFNNTPQRPYSVPYTANYAVDACCEDVLKTMSF